MSSIHDDHYTITASHSVVDKATHDPVRLHKPSVAVQYTPQH